MGGRPAAEFWSRWAFSPAQSSAGTQPMHVPLATRTYCQGKEAATGPGNRSWEAQNNSPRAASIEEAAAIFAVDSRWSYVFCLRFCFSGDGDWAGSNPMPLQ